MRWLHDQVRWALTYPSSRLFALRWAFELWGTTSSYTLRKYIKVARSRMAQELVRDRSLHIAEQI